jgi:SRSO17 transposase
MEIERWLEELERLHARISKCFDRPEPRRRALAYVKGLLGPVSRKNGWQLAEQAGETSPDGMQRLLRDAHWDREAVCAELRSYLLQQFGRTGGVLVVDETSFRKKGRHSAGVKRQYCGTTGQVENCQVGVFLYYATVTGGAFIDRELYLPEDWSDDRLRCRDAGVPDDVLFQTKPELARVMLRRARDAGLRPEWTVGDAVYGSAPALRADLEAWRWAYVLGIRRTEPVRPATDDGLIARPAGDLVAALPAYAWRRLRAGEGSKGSRLYDWALVPLVHLTATTGSHALLVRRSLEDPTDLALFLVFTPRATTLAEIVCAAGQRWHIETGFEAAKGEVGLGHYEVRLWDAWYRHITLALLAYAFLAVIRARATPVGKKDAYPDPSHVGRNPPLALPLRADGSSHP